MRRREGLKGGGGILGGGGEREKEEKWRNGGGKEGGRLDWGRERTEEGNRHSAERSI